MIVVVCSKRHLVKNPICLNPAAAITIAHDKYWLQWAKCPLFIFPLFVHIQNNVGLEMIVKHVFLY